VHYGPRSQRAHAAADRAWHGARCRDAMLSAGRLSRLRYACRSGGSRASLRWLAVPGESTRLPDAADPSDCRRDCKSANPVKGPGRHTLRHSFATPGGRRRSRSYPGPAGGRPADMLQASQLENLAFSRRRRARPTGGRAATRARSPICSVLPGLPIRSRMQASSASAAQGHFGVRALPHGRRTRPTADRAQLPWSSHTSMR
jgi:hypothetical protein